MHSIMRPAWVLVLALLSAEAASAAETQTEYKQADTSYYLRGEVFAADPAAPVIAPEAATNVGGTYLIATRGQAPRYVYLPETHDWIEPITPPSEPASLNIAPTAMQVREPQGTVQVALPTAPADFRDVDPGTPVPNGSTLRTGDSGSVAVLFGGVDSVRLAPNTLATVQMKVAGGLRDVEVDVRGGMVFSKVGARVGERQHYAVHTPFGDATAHGTDYVTVVYPQRTDVWVAQGTVELKAPDGASQVTASSGHEPLKVMRYPAPRDPATGLAESAESLTALLNFIPMANRKLAALNERRTRGAELTPQEKDYVGRIRQVVALIRLADVHAVPEPLPVAKAVVPTTPPVAPRAQLVALPAPVPALHKAAPKPFAVAETARTSASPAKTKAIAKAKPLAAKPLALAEGKTGARKPDLKAPSGKTKSVAWIAAKKPESAKVAAVTAPKSRATVATTGKTEPAVEGHYLRAQPVNPADLVESPAVQTVPPPLAPPPSTPPPSAAPPEAHGAAEADPNSLGARLNPLRPMLAPAPSGPAATIGSAGQ